MDDFLKPSFSLKNKIFRIIWNLVYILLFYYSPRPFHSWRRQILKLFGAKIGHNSRIYPKVSIWAPWNIEIGFESIIANNVILYSQGKIIIGNRVVISQGSHICASTHDYTKKSFPLILKYVHIHNFVWIATEVFIHPGIIIHEGVVVGARSVVTKSLNKWRVYSGNPCIDIKERILTD